MMVYESMGTLGWESYGLKLFVMAMMEMYESLLGCVSTNYANPPLGKFVKVLLHHNGLGGSRWCLGLGSAINTYSRFIYRASLMVIRWLYIKCECFFCRCFCFHVRIVADDFCLTKSTFFIDIRFCRRKFVERWSMSSQPEAERKDWIAHCFFGLFTC